MSNIVVRSMREVEDEVRKEGLEYCAFWKKERN